MQLILIYLQRMWSQRRLEFESEDDYGYIK